MTARVTYATAIKLPVQLTQLNKKMTTKLLISHRDPASVRAAGPALERAGLSRLVICRGGRVRWVTSGLCVAGCLTRDPQTGLMAPPSSAQRGHRLLTGPGARLLTREHGAKPPTHKCWAPGPSPQHPPHEGGRREAKDDSGSRRGFSSQPGEG